MGSVDVGFAVNVRNNIGNGFLFPLHNLIKSRLAEIDIDKKNPFAHTAQGNGKIGRNR